ncbi:Glycogenin-1 [Psilocybe cubensis]|uniref:Glycogenin-1 n=2 Tax=Psilocybe cubensis TaxID=181762 RepID=A0ACB8HF39_PSICU|nr:Glycogenin-1 [Psilocybe cubensis]KAH9486518.1 Glycogenin-1 [Psilocybe cubensis]
MFAFVTLVSSDAYLPGALAQVAALRDIHPSPAQPPEHDFHTVCLVTPESLDVATIKALRRAFDLVVGVEILEQHNPAGLKLLGRPDLTTVLTKLHVFRLTQFQKIVFLDADVLPIRPISHLFSIAHEFSAAPDVGWPDIFNSGVLVLSPGQDKFDQLYQLVATRPSWDGGDQGLLNEWRDGDWNRLSFTYNTTPTAAYTYAPAYERYGSQIKAIHFIGPNKPWNNIPYRTPGRQPSTQSSQTTYDYDSLVDRWFDVYDRHYASTPTQKSPFEIKRYTSAWDPSAEPQNPPPAPLDLDELKRLAIQGLNASQEDSHPGEGAYKSMPLQGRVDLMRPRKPDPKPVEPVVKPHDPRLSAPSINAYTQDTDDSDRFPTEPFHFHDEILATPIARRASLGDEPRWRTLPTPGPNEIPPSPRLRLVSLPPTPSPFAPLPTTAPDFYASESEAESFLLARSDSAHENRPDSRHHHHHHHRSTPNHEHHHHHQHYSPPQNSQSYRHDEQRQHESPKRPASPPMMSWNPAIEPPPNVTPAPNAFPTDTYFANVWDQTPSRQNDQIPSSSIAHTSPPDSGGFFQPPPPPVIPDTLLKQGHYRNVTGDIQTGSTPSPDKKKIKSIFPWEEKPRVMPGRVFPDSDAPPPSLFLSPGSQSQSHTDTTTTPSTPETRSTGTTRATQLSPLYGLPSAFSYANAWDSVPSIQKYASKLVKPAQPLPHPPQLAPPYEDDAYARKVSRKKSWDERAEVSSRDGDDEDNADDEEDEEGRPVASNSTKWVDDEDGSDRENAKRRSRRGSVVTASTLLGINKKKEYRSRGVQTIIVEKRSQGIQVQVEAPSPRQHYHARRGSASNRRHWAPATASTVVAPMTTTRDVSIGPPVNVGPAEQQHHHKKKETSVSPSFSPRRPAREFVVPPPNAGRSSGFVSPPPQPAKSASQSKSGTITPNARLMAQQHLRAAVAPIARSSSAPQSGNHRPPSGHHAHAPPVKPAVSNSNAKPFAPPAKPTIRTSNSSTSTLVPATASPAIHSAPPTMMPAHPSLSNRTSPTASVVARRPSNDSSLGSPVSSAGPLSPPDGHALLLSPGSQHSQGTPLPGLQGLPQPTRKGTRVWDPARGVDLFKRESEDVIARFLKMGAWEEEGR